MSFSHAGKANSAPSNELEGPLQGGGKRGEGKGKGRQKTLYFRE